MLSRIIVHIKKNNNVYLSHLLKTAVVNRFGFTEEELYVLKGMDGIWVRTLTHQTVVVFLGGPLGQPIPVMSIVFF